MKIELSANQQTIVNAITSGLNTAAAIAEKTGLTKAAISANMKPLRDKGVITTTEVDGHVVMSLTGEAKAARVDAAFAPAIAKAEKAKKATAPATFIGQDARTVRDTLLAAGNAPRVVATMLMTTNSMSKKAAKALVYDNRVL